MLKESLCLSNLCQESSLVSEWSLVILRRNMIIELAYRKEFVYVLLKDRL